MNKKPNGSDGVSIINNMLRSEKAAATLSLKTESKNVEKPMLLTEEHAIKDENRNKAKKKNKWEDRFDYKENVILNKKIEKNSLDKWTDDRTAGDKSYIVSAIILSVYLFYHFNLLPAALSKLGSTYNFFFALAMGLISTILLYITIFIAEEYTPIRLPRPRIPILESSLNALYNAVFDNKIITLLIVAGALFTVKIGSTITVEKIIINRASLLAQCTKGEAERCADLAELHYSGIEAIEDNTMNNPGAELRGIRTQEAN